MSHQPRKAPAAGVKLGKHNKSSRSSTRTKTNPLDFEAAKEVLRDVLRAELESETVPSEVLSFRMKRSR
jgi:hypothetical protein